MGGASCPRIIEDACVQTSGAAGPPVVMAGTSETTEIPQNERFAVQKGQNQRQIPCASESCPQDNPQMWKS